jgi:Lon protease-like protein
MQREPFTPPELSDALLARIPLFPLPGTVLFPHAVLPLHFFEPRYKALAEHCVEGPRVMALGTLRDAPEGEGADGEADEGTVAGPGGTSSDGAEQVEIRGETLGHLSALPNPATLASLPPVHRVVTLGAVAAHRRLPDGRWDIALRGLCRAEVVAEVASGDPFRRVQVRRLRERERPEDPRLAAELRSAAVQLANLVPPLWAQLNPHLLEARTPAALADVMAALFLDDAAARRALIDETRVSLRLERVIEAVAGHLLDLSVRAAERGAERPLN